MRGPLTVLGALLAVSLAPRSAHATPIDDAKASFARGRELRANQDCFDAIPFFQKAHEVFPEGLGSLRNLAECQESVGWIASARRTWLDLKRSLDRSADPKYQGWADDANQAVARLAPKVPTLTLDVVLTTAGGQPVSLSRPVSGGPGDVLSRAGIELSANGKRVPPEFFGAPLDLDPGRYAIRLAGPWIQSPPQEIVDLAPGDAKRVTVRAVVNDESAPGDRVDRSATTSGGVQRTIGWASIGVGASALIGAGVSLFVRQSAASDVRNKASAAHCPAQGDNFQCVGASSGVQQSLQQSEDAGQTANAFAIVFAAVGAVGIASGALLVATSPSRSTEVGLVVTGSGIAAVGRF